MTLILRASLTVVFSLFWVVAQAAEPNPPGQVCEQSLFVSPLGSDEWSGTLAEPNAGLNDGPFRSPKKALERMASCSGRWMPAAQLRRIVLRGGLYLLPEPLAITPAIAGAGAPPLRIEAYDGERPILSGGRILDNWKVGADGFWRTRLEDVVRGKWKFSQLFVDGQRRTRPRYPAQGYLSAVGPIDPTEAAGALGHNRFKFNPIGFPSDALLGQHAELLVFHSWTTSRLPVAQIDRTSSILTAHGHTFTSNNNGRIRAGARYFFDNVAASELQAGQWHLDHSTGELTYAPFPGESPLATQVVAPLLPTLLRIGNAYGAKELVGRIEFRNLVFEHTNWNMPTNGRSAPQAEVGLPAAVEVGAAQDITLDHVGVIHTGAHAISIGSSSSRIRIQNCELRDLGAGGLQIGTPNIGAAVPPPQDVSPAIDRDRVFISRNLISAGGRTSPGAVAIWVGNMDNVTIKENEIHDFYYSGISVGWTWGYGKSGAHHNTIIGNHVHQIGKGVLSDLGGIYLLGSSPGTVVAKNVIHDVDVHQYGGWGIYADQGASFLDIYDNLVFRTRDGGFHIHFGFANEFHNNIIALGERSEVRCSRQEQHLSVRFRANVFYHEATSPVFVGECNGGSFAFEHNAYWRTSNVSQFYPGLPALANWSMGDTFRDRDSIEVDPKFKNPTNGDFRVESDSPLREQNFGPAEVPASIAIAPQLTSRLPQVPDTFEGRQQRQ
ncbi:right-handed parallel beta-helix repeat-containing protein [Bradyrhizobium sp. IC3069]|uniref:right-handed parallel beta-helix repeat-containing protein n=1 Tax=unclassified Bradyrhizobium TaxID=2631580 RepID=UPI001CD60242|nr:MULTISPECIES: right-handed parallel beta-helix repeat-containing protein [unclassified Bradyrhizobium]MCA1364607.1 right-handed parallel beta-helix repeat-containing protein [Bradyrhizobium sp. IC4059]MCA1521593.1 right-handed parallel beta-helix repeat-containing protein [Bradyrhizobium sp. IC3069]